MNYLLSLVIVGFGGNCTLNDFKIIPYFNILI
jgi:hypothetical protein